MLQGYTLMPSPDILPCVLDFCGRFWLGNSDDAKQDFRSRGKQWKYYFSWTATPKLFQPLWNVILPAPVLGHMLFWKELVEYSLFADRSSGRHVIRMGLLVFWYFRDKYFFRLAPYRLDYKVFTSESPPTPGLGRMLIRQRIGWVLSLYGQF